MNWVFLLISTSLSCHSARKACLELQNRHFKKLKKLLPGVRFPSGRLRVLGKVLFHGPQPTYATVPLSRRAKVNLGMWILRLRLRLRTEWQGGKYTAEFEYFRNRENNHRVKPTIPIKKGTGAMCMGFWLILGTLFFDWFMCCLFNKSGSNCTVCRCFV